MGGGGACRVVMLPPSTNMKSKAIPLNSLSLEFFSECHSNGSKLFISSPFSAVDYFAFVEGRMLQEELL